MTLHSTLRFAHDMHEGVSDWTGMPYITHPIAVMMLLPPECSDEDRQIALLHDVFEDCRSRLCAEFGMSEITTSLDELFDAFSRWPHPTDAHSDYVVRGLRLLTRDLWPGLNYINYVRNIVSSGHRGAMWVKYADNRHNTDPARRALLSPELLEKSIQMESRYFRSMAILREGLGIT
jgi:hypothetical protein